MFYIENVLRKLLSNIDFSTIPPESYATDEHKEANFLVLCIYKRPHLSFITFGPCAIENNQGIVDLFSITFWITEKNCARNL